MSETLSYFTGEESDAERMSEVCSRSQLINDEARLGTQPLASRAHAVDTRPLSVQSPVRLWAEAQRCPATDGRFLPPPAPFALLPLSLELYLTLPLFYSFAY